MTSLSLSDFVSLGLSGNDMVCYFALKQHADTDGKCFPGYERLMEITQLSDRTLHKCVDKLEAAGLITVTNRTHTKQGNRSNYYVLTEYKNFAKPPKKVRSNITPPEGLIKKGFSSLEEKLAHFDPSQENKALYDQLVGKGQFRAYVARFKNNCLRRGYNYNCLEEGLNKFIENTAQREASKKGSVKPTEASKEPLQPIEPSKPLEGFTEDQRAIWNALSKSLSNKVGARNVIAENLANLKLVERKNRLVIEVTSGAGWAIKDLVSKNAGFAGEVCTT